MRNISFQDLFKPLGSDPPAIRREVTCVYFGSSISRGSRPTAQRSNMSLVSDDEPAAHGKGSIGFILGGSMKTTSTSSPTALTVATTYATPTRDATPAQEVVCISKADDPFAAGCGHRRSKRSPPATVSDCESSPAPATKKRKARICKETGCEKYVVDHGLCIRHGVSGPEVVLEYRGNPGRSRTRCCTGRKALQRRRVQLQSAESRSLLEARCVTRPSCIEMIDMEQVLTHAGFRLPPHRWLHYLQG
jgi:hypothetical protein